MNKKILLLGLTIMLISNSLLLLLVSQVHLRSFAGMLLVGSLTMVVWYIFLKKDVAIGIKSINRVTLKDTSPLLLLPFLGSIYLLSTTLKIEYEIVSLMLVSSISTGIYEELVFRGITLGSLISSGVKPYKAIIVSALLFSLFHLYSAYQYEVIDIVLKMLNTFMMGVIFAYIYYVTSNILYIIAIHTIWDFQSFLSTRYISDNIGTSIAIILFAMTLLYFRWSYQKMSK